MYHHSDIEVWREHRHELLREAEKGRLARRLRVERRSNKDSRIKSALLALVPGRLPRRKEPAEC